MKAEHKWKIRMANSTGGGGGRRADSPLPGEGAGGGDWLGGVCSVLVGRSGGITRSCILPASKYPLGKHSGMTNLVSSPVGPLALQPSGAITTGVLGGNANITKGKAVAGIRLGCMSPLIMANSKLPEIERKPVQNGHKNVNKFHQIQVVQAEGAEDENRHHIIWH